MQNIFIDSDVSLDYILKREPHFEDAVEIFLRLQNKTHKGFISSLSLSHLSYFIQKDFDKELIIPILKKLRKIIEVSTVDSIVIDQSLDSKFSDFEDAIQHYSALSIQADYIITRNKKDFKESKIKVLTPKEFLAL